MKSLHMQPSIASFFVPPTHRSQKWLRQRADMRAIGVSELKTHASEIIRRVREERVSYTITFRGKPVGVLLPFEGSGDEVADKSKDPWSDLEKLREKMAAMPRPKKTLSETLSEMRR